MLVKFQIIWQVIISPSKLKSIVETGDLGYQQCLDQGVDNIRSGNNLEAMLKDADIAELNRLEREKEELARKREEEESASRKKEELIYERLIEEIGMIEDKLTSIKWISVLNLDDSVIRRGERFEIP